MQKSSFLSITRQSSEVNLRRAGSLVFLLSPLPLPAESLVLCSCLCWLNPPPPDMPKTDWCFQAVLKKTKTPASLPSLTLLHTICSLFSPWLAAPGASGCCVPLLEPWDAHLIKTAPCAISSSVSTATVNKHSLLGLQRGHDLQVSSLTCWKCHVMQEILRNPESDRERISWLYVKTGVWWWCCAAY